MNLWYISWPRFQSIWTKPAWNFLRDCCLGPGNCQRLAESRSTTRLQTGTPILLWQGTHGWAFTFLPPTVLSAKANSFYKWVQLLSLFTDLFARCYFAVAFTNNMPLSILMPSSQYPEEFQEQIGSAPLHTVRSTQKLICTNALLHFSHTRLLPLEINSY